MHPSEMKNRALVAAAAAEREGFLATAEALLVLAKMCAVEAIELKNELGWVARAETRSISHARTMLPEPIH